MANEEVMLAFYRRLFPFKPVYHWLNQEYAPTRLFTQREFAFTLKGDVYLRYQSFMSAEEWKKQVCHFNPTRFEIGPMYSARPCDKKSVRPNMFTPQLRELVFDIDMTDYDEVRTCCKGADICRRCWAFITVAVHVLDAAIRDQFGYSRLLWVYSGRRGIHLWISDKEALELTDEQRRAVVGWLNIVRLGKEAKRPNLRQGLRELPPSLKTALSELNSVFSDLILKDQNCFGSQEGYEQLLRYIPNKSVVSALEEKWKDEPSRSSSQKWDDLTEQVKKLSTLDSKERTNLMHAREDIILDYTYPRLDAEVSKHRNHLLKAPFCIHPKTGRVCVPIDPARIDEFDPTTVPTVGQLLTELASAPAKKAADNNEDQMDVDAQGGAKDHRPDWEKTSLRPYVEMFERYNAAIMEDIRLVKREAAKNESRSDW
ncbi:prim-pol domain-containing protein [Fistulina hepatica ATCC 64428]|uniref:DNA primase n=1 Tax=Fistulina hepatica ATCC 64428 TaxID=1128425 RepID=A0A0D7A1K9_9AGAR|nr:prim-pol domain-containing protein [Fistulina hepatica ATCC 64428]